MKSFNINNEMRREVARQLTTDAIQKTAIALYANITKLNDAFWAQHRTNVEQISGIPADRWLELIRAGVMSATACAEICVEDDDGRYPCVEMIRLSREQGDMIGSLINPQKLPAFFNFIQSSRYDRHRQSLVLKTESSVPLISGFMMLKRDSELVAQIEQIKQQYRAMIDAAFAFNDNVMDVLNSCRTSRQLENLFPEAAKLLPQPVQKTSELAPVELVASVQKMFKTGIPSEPNKRKVGSKAA